MCGCQYKYQDNLAKGKIPIVYYIVLKNLLLQSCV